MPHFALESCWLVPGHRYIHHLPLIKAYDDPESGVPRNARDLGDAEEPVTRSSHSSHLSTMAFIAHDINGQRVGQD